jgi:anti-sigma B factor antagonist
MLSRIGPGGEKAMGFQLHTREIDRVVVVEAVGRLTLTDGHTKLRDLMHVSIGDGAKKFIFNFAQVEFIDSFGIGELARCYSVVRRAGGDAKLANVSQRVFAILALSRLDTIFDIHSSEDAALRSFAQRA